MVLAHDAVLRQIRDLRPVRRGTALRRGRDLPPGVGAVAGGVVVGVGRRVAQANLLKRAEPEQIRIPTHLCRIVADCLAVARAELRMGGVDLDCLRPLLARHRAAVSPETRIFRRQHLVSRPVEGRETIRARRAAFLERLGERCRLLVWILAGLEVVGASGRTAQHGEPHIGGRLTELRMRGAEAAELIVGIGRKTQRIGRQRRDHEQHAVGREIERVRSVLVPRRLDGALAVPRLHTRRPAERHEALMHVDALGIVRRGDEQRAFARSVPREHLAHHQAAAVSGGETAHRGRVIPAHVRGVANRGDFPGRKADEPRASAAEAHVLAVEGADFGDELLHDGVTRRLGTILFEDVVLPPARRVAGELQVRRAKREIGERHVTHLVDVHRELFEKGVRLHIQRELPAVVARGARGNRHHAVAPQQVRRARLGRRRVGIEVDAHLLRRRYEFAEAAHIVLVGVRPQLHARLGVTARDVRTVVRQDRRARHRARHFRLDEVEHLPVVRQVGLAGLIADHDLANGRMGTPLLRRRLEHGERTLLGHLPHQLRLAAPPAGESADLRGETVFREEIERRAVGHGDAARVVGADLLQGPDALFVAHGSGEPAHANGDAFIRKGGEGGCGQSDGGDELTWLHGV